MRLAWRVLSAGADDFVAVPDALVEPSVALLAALEADVAGRLVGDRPRGAGALELADAALEGAAHEVRGVGVLGVRARRLEGERVGAEVVQDAGRRVAVRHDVVELEPLHLLDLSDVDARLEAEVLVRHPLEPREFAPFEGFVIDTRDLLGRGQERDRGEHQARPRGAPGDPEVNQR